jgi:hypothetical protein
MIWSKLKKSVEALLADAIKSHLQIYLTRYGQGVSYSMNRAWITWDEEEICTFSTIKWLRERNALAAQRLTMDASADGYASRQEAVSSLAQSGNYPVERFLGALETYVSFGIDEALQSDDELIRAWTMFDRRLGKRRLLAMGLQPIEHPLVRDWYRRRCEAETMPVPEWASPGH